MRIGLAIRLDQPVAAEIPVRRSIPEIPAIRPEFLPIRGFLTDPLIYPVPDTPALQGLVTFDGLPVIAEIAQAVPHRVRIFTQNQRPGRIGLGIFHDLRNPGIHRTVYIRVRSQLGPLVLNRPGTIPLFDPVIGCCKIWAVSCFVAQRPDNHTRMIFVPLDHPLGAVQMGFEPAAVLGQRFRPIAHPVRFNIGLVDDIQSMPVAQLIPLRTIRVMARANRVDIILFHQPDISNH
ncbi:MAG: hypothetical protein BWY71_00900 [Planctomycetes bacterium ADurb.Bin412]|nr:MAG: hypothetical protein BWY71_00900 [Planctomycetes bacterium ADurb.Bin412]